jgi:cardiolipin synthase
MLESIAGAQNSIDLESYIFAADEVGWRFAAALAERADAGVRVRVHIDAAGSLFYSSRRLEKFLRQHGVELRWFHRWSWQQPWRYNRRNHRKLLVTDEQTAYLGGFNIHRENSLALYGEKRWRDTHLKMRGRLASVAAQLFDTFWHGDRRWLPDTDSGDSSLVHNHTRTCRHRLRCIYESAFASAREYLYLTTPYFVPDHHTQKGLRAAAQRGVDVRLLLPRKSDVRISQWAARSAYAGLFAAGVRIYEYLPRMLHAKTTVVDHDWAMVGTANLDYRSLFVNYELNLVTRNPVLSSVLKQQFLDDLKLSEQILPIRWYKRGWIAHCTEMVGWIARRWL